MVEGLLPPRIEAVLIPLVDNMLSVYNLAYLDQHTDRTLNLLDQAVHKFSQKARSLHRESIALRSEILAKDPNRRVPSCSHSTPKFHMLDHMTFCIRRLGPLNNYTTAFVSGNRKPFCLSVY